MTLYKNKETRAKLLNTSRGYRLKVYYLAQSEDAPEKEAKIGRVLSNYPITSYNDSGYTEMFELNQHTMEFIENYGIASNSSPIG